MAEIANAKLRVLGGYIVTQGTLTADKQALDITATLNNAGVTFTGIKLNWTNTASAAASKLIDLQVGGVTQFNVTRAGVLTCTGTANSTKSGGGTAAAFYANAALPGYAWRESGAGADAKVWDLIASGGILFLRAINDAESVANNVLSFERSGAGVGLMTVGANLKVTQGISLSGATAPTHGIQFGSSAPGTLTNGQIWYDGTNLKARLGGATVTIQVA